MYNRQISIIFVYKYYINMIHLFSEKFPLKYNIPGIYYIQINSHSYVGRQLNKNSRIISQAASDNSVFKSAHGYQ